ncbi:kanadaptin [Patella vulgata]|uniref:kanadaptin n=1 Tax=Patella vulgata TaxID=6465 RepID=UPI0024A8FD2A|nr:kanadaptin [Patella vulgata]
MADKNENVIPTLDVNTNNIESKMETLADNDAEENGINKDSKDSNPFKTPTIQFKMPEKLPLTSPITNLENEKAQNVKQIKKPSNQESPTPNSTKEKVKTSNSSPAESLQQAQVVFPYKEPSWSGLPEPGYSFEILKNGAIIENIELKDKAFYMFGRLPSCDVTMEHPSLSRYHAVIQYCKNPESSVSQSGWYLYDLDSTHGTWLNKNKVKPNVYHRIRVGHVVKFGGSTRLHILQGPETDQDEESELSVTEIKQQRDRQKREAEVLRLADADESNRLQQKMNQDEGCSWGMGEEAEEEAEEIELDVIYLNIL